MNGLDGGQTRRVLHLTRYTYAEPVAHSLHKGFLTPRATPFQILRESRVSVDPPFRSSTTYEDYFGNQATLFTVDKPHSELRVEAESELTIFRTPDVPEHPRCNLNLDIVRQKMRESASEEDLKAYEFCFDSPHVSQAPEFARYASSCFGEQVDLLDGVANLMHRIHSGFRYDPTVTTVSTPVSEVLVHKGGVCQDFAHLMIACLRSLGLAARYVSGYLVPGPNVVGAQASHAWISAYCPGMGWLDFDPTNGVLPSGNHITLAWGRDYSDVSPFGGVVLGGGAHEVSVEVSVSPE